METKRKKTVKFQKEKKTEEQKPKSKTTLFWEKNYLNGEKGEIINMRAVLK